MLKFSRNKLISIAKRDTQTLSVHGVLEDVIYGLEADMEIDITTMEILSVNGKWIRYTTPECPKALSYLQNAVGYNAGDKDIAHQIQKSIGRKACGHFANLMIDCCFAAKEAVLVLQWENAKKETIDLTFEQFMAKDIKPVVQAKPRRATPKDAPHVHQTTPEKKPDATLKKEIQNKFGSKATTVIDLHVHSYPASSCSTVSEDDLIEQAKKIGLDGICLTDHNHVWDPDRTRELSQKHGFLVLSGNEITTDQGHILVFGLDKVIKNKGIVRLEDLRKDVDQAQGFMIVSHPFRGFLAFGVGNLGLRVEDVVQRDIFKHIDAIEVRNGKVTQDENDFSAAVADRLNMFATGGSDAHSTAEVGLHATQFYGKVKTETDLIEMLKCGQYSPVSDINRQPTTVKNVPAR